MKKIFIFSLLFLLVILTASTQEGFNGPKRNGSFQQFIQPQLVTITVDQVRNYPDDTKVILTGNILYSINHEEYMFRDTTGEIVVEIDRRIWHGLSITPNDVVEITGEIDFERNDVEIDVKNIRKTY